MLDPKIEKKQKLGNCIWMRLDNRRRKTSPGYELNLDLYLWNYLPDWMP